MKIAIKLNQQIQRWQSDTVKSENCECLCVSVSVEKPKRMEKSICKEAK